MEILGIILCASNHHIPSQLLYYPNQTRHNHANHGSTMSSTTDDPRRFAYLVGIGVTHSIAPPMHTYAFQSMGHPWTFIAQECPTVEDAVALFRQPTFAGGVVTMPYKRTIMEHLDGLDEYAVRLQACNNVYRAEDGSLRGTNTDWRGIKGCLLSADPEEKGRGKAAVIVGAGGACRAAVYALYEELGCTPIYVVNRDEEEVRVLRQETEKEYGEGLKMVHVERVEQVAGLLEKAAPGYMVGTVPDAEPVTAEEKEVHRIVEAFLDAPFKGVLLDMCFKPRQTRFLKMAGPRGWATVEGTEVIGHQMPEQYRLWCGEEERQKLSLGGAWSVLRKAAEESPGINF